MTFTVHDTDPALLEAVRGFFVPKSRSNSSGGRIWTYEDIHAEAGSLLDEPTTIFIDGAAVAEIGPQP